jgi:hypothetical protein
MTRTPSSHKFLQSIDDDYYYLLGRAAKIRGVTVQELVRAVIIPDWISKTRRKAAMENVKALEAFNPRSRITFPEPATLGPKP